jgi:predicted RNase H-like nuclease (RuvC/YqgF family)
MNKQCSSCGGFCGKVCERTNQFKPDYNTEAVLVKEIQRMAKRIENLEAIIERQTARIVDLQEHIENFDGEDR